MSGEGGTDLVALARRFAELAFRKRALKDSLDDIDAELATIEPTLLEAFADARIRPPLKVTTDSGAVLSVYVRRDIWTRAAEDADEALHAALRRNNLGHFVKPTVSVQTLSAWYREQIKAGESIPPDIQAAIAVVDKYSVQTRKA